MKATHAQSRVKRDQVEAETRVLKAIFDSEGAGICLKHTAGEAIIRCLPYWVVSFVMCLAKLKGVQ